MPNPPRPDRVSIQSIWLGPLEARIMDVIWERGQSSVREVMPYLSPLAYTTVMTTMAHSTRRASWIETRSVALSSTAHDSRKSDGDENSPRLFWMRSFRNRSAQIY